MYDDDEFDIDQIDVDVLQELQKINAIPFFSDNVMFSYLKELSYTGQSQHLKDIGLNNISSRSIATVRGVLKRLHMKRDVTIHNQSGKKAWVILAPTPFFSVGSIEVDKVGQIAFNCIGDYKFQQSPLSNNVKRKFFLDTTNIYFSVFFECDGKWKVHFKDVKNDTSVYDINLLPRHIEEAVDIDAALLYQGK